MTSPELLIVRTSAVTPPSDFVGLARAVLVLAATPWDDYGFKTTHRATLLCDGQVTPLGFAKVGSVLPDSLTETPWPAVFATTGAAQLPEFFVSTGGSRGYYDALWGRLGTKAISVLRAMRDIALLVEGDSTLLESVVRISLLRFAAADDAHRHARGLVGGVNRDHNMEFTFRDAGARGSEWKFSFGRDPLHRIHVLVGAASVGKTRLLSQLVEFVVGTNRDVARLDPRPPLSGAAVISTNPFDATRWLPSAPERNYQYYGLHRFVQDPDQPRLPDGRVNFRATLDEGAMRVELAERLGRQARDAPTHDAFINAIDDLAVVGMTSFGESVRQSVGLTIAQSSESIKHMSSGEQATLMLLAPFFVGHERNTLYVVDEPESHLHPRLLHQLLRIIGERLHATDSFAVVATHSPLILQQSLARHVHVLSHGQGVRPLRAQCFGASLTEILTDSFGGNADDHVWIGMLKAWVEREGLEEVERELGSPVPLAPRMVLDALTPSSHGHSSDKGVP